jgi:hypothetical protein
MRLEQYVGITSKPGDYLMNLRVGKFELDAPFSEARSQKWPHSFEQPPEIFKWSLC